MYCYFCHGYAGDARTVASRYLAPPPRDFTVTGATQLGRQQMLEVVKNGKKGTAMQSFDRQLSIDDMAAVVDFIRNNFMQAQQENTYYHILENGWDNFAQYAAAFPYALGELAIDRPVEEMTAEQKQGLRLFLSSCITCHEAVSSTQNELGLTPRAVSYPRGGYSHKQAVANGITADAVTSATPYARHDRAPVVTDLTEQQQQGEKLYQENCAFCHAADGTGKNWIGSFLEPPPRDLTDAEAMAGMTRQRLKQTIRDGREGTTMPAWKSVLSDEQIEAVITYIDSVFIALPD